MSLAAGTDQHERELVDERLAGQEVRRCLRHPPRGYAGMASAARSRTHWHQVAWLVGTCMIADAMADAAGELLELIELRSERVWFRVSQKCSRVSQKCKGYQIAARRGRSIKNPYLKGFQRSNLVK